ncbi:EGF-like domain protein, partial [Oesophagostomum dentatum]
NIANPTSAPDYSQYTIPQGRKIAPGSNCGPLDTCVGGAMCVDGLCVCPSGMQASAQGRCERVSSTAAPSSAMILKPGSVHATELTYQHTHQPASRPRPPSTSSYSTASASTLHVTHASTPTLTNANTASEVDECASIGLYCRGNTVCRNLSCQCPDGFVLHNDGCIPPDEASRRKVCACPPEKPVLQGDTCIAQQYRKIATPGESCDENTECTKESTCQAGQCRCQYGYIAISGQCVALPMPTTPTLKNVVLAKPLNSCDNGEQCEGGSTCDQETGVCMCPPGYIVFGTECRLPPQSPAQPAVNSMPQPAQVQTPSFSTANTECVDDTNCGANKVCVVGRCKCKPGFVDHDGVCEPLEKIELGERPVPVSFAKHKVETLSSERVVEQQEFTESVAQPRPPSRQETQRPRIVGPPIRRPKPKSKGTTGTTPGSYKTTTGAGACPRGNEPTRDDEGRLISCNGLEPNCPPRSYCYITSGGFATEEYNCCKSW